MIKFIFKNLVGYLDGKLQDKVAAITGEAFGSRAATVRVFIKKGTKVVPVDLTEEKGDVFEAELEVLTVEVLFVKTKNIASEKQEANLPKQTRRLLQLYK